MGLEGLIARWLTDNNFAQVDWPVDNRPVVLKLSPGLWLDRCSRKVITP